MCLLLNQKRAVVDAHDKEVLTFFRFLLVCLFSIRGAMNQYLQQNLNSLMSVWPRFSLSICLSVCLESSDTLIFNFSSRILTIRNIHNTRDSEPLDPGVAHSGKAQPTAIDVLLKSLYISYMLPPAFHTRTH